MRLVCRPSRLQNSVCQLGVYPYRILFPALRVPRHKDAPFHFPGGQTEKARMMYISTYMSGKT